MFEDGDGGRVEGSAKGVLVGVIGHTNDSVVDASVVDESEIGAIERVLRPHK